MKTLLLWAVILFLSGIAGTFLVTEFYRWIPSVLFWSGAITLTVHEYRAHQKAKARHAAYMRVREG